MVGIKMPTMKTVRLASFVVAVALLAGCATTFRPWMLSEVQNGMSRDQVVQLLGEPDYVESQNGAVHLYYTYAEDYVQGAASRDLIEYETTLDLRKSQIERSFNETRYVVRLENDRVVGYRELTD
jgi:outer membrane protein assembly factor BamE (lipoprotein component of BamABCDE complex)